MIVLMPSRSAEAPCNFETRLRLMGAGSCGEARFFRWNLLNHLTQQGPEAQTAGIGCVLGSVGPGLPAATLANGDSGAEHEPGRFKISLLLEDSRPTTPAATVRRAVLARYLHLATDRYKLGIDSHLNVITAQTSYLSTRKHWQSR